MGEAARVFCGTEGHFCSIGCQVQGAHRDWAIGDPWVVVEAVVRCPICKEVDDHRLSCPTRWYA